MEIGKVAAEYRIMHWEQIMRERKESGLTIKAFCENKGVRQNLYYYWQRKVREAVCEQITQPEHLIPTGFAEVKLTEPPTQPNVKTTSQLRIEVAGIQITADNAYPTGRLAELLRGLVGSC